MRPSSPPRNVLGDVGHRHAHLLRTASMLGSKSLSGTACHGGPLSLLGRSWRTLNTYCKAGRHVGDRQLKFQESWDNHGDRRLVRRARVGGGGDGGLGETRRYSDLQCDLHCPLRAVGELDNSDDGGNDDREPKQQDACLGSGSPLTKVSRAAPSIPFGMGMLLDVGQAHRRAQRMHPIARCGRGHFAGEAPAPATPPGKNQCGHGSGGSGMALHAWQDEGA